MALLEHKIVKRAEQLQQSVQSSNLSEVKYDTDLMVLTVTFNNGSVYEYFTVPINVYEDLINASSHGSYFYRNIRNSFSYRKI